MDTVLKSDDLAIMKGVGVVLPLDFLGDTPWTLPREVLDAAGDEEEDALGKGTKMDDLGSVIQAMRGNAREG